MNKKRLLLTLLPTSVLVIGVVLAVYFHLNKPDGKDIIVAEKDDGTTAVMIDNSPAPAKDENGDIPAANVPELTELEETENEDTTVTGKEKETENQLILGMLQGGTFYFSSKDLKMYLVHKLRSVFYFASKDKILLIYYVF